MVKVVWSESAVVDLEAVVEYIARDSEYYAAAFADKVLKAVEKLGTFPKMGRIVPEYGRDDLRELIFQSYRIIYKVGSEQVAIVALVHSSMDLVSRFAEEARDI